MRLQLAASAVAVLLGGLGSAACDWGPTNTVHGSGHVVTESRNVTGFSSVNLTGTGVLVVTQGDSESLTIQTDDNIVKRIRSTVVSGELRIGPDPNTSLQPSQPIRMTVSAKTIDGLRIDGSGDIQATRLQSDALRLAIDGSGNIDVSQLSTPNLTTTINGSGNVHLAGTASHEELTIPGSGGYFAGSLASDSARVTITGSGQCELKVSTTLQVVIDGSGDVRYTGSPSVSERRQGSGSVVKVG